MSAKDIIIDFLNYVFLIAVSIFMLFYVIFGDRMQAFSELLNVLMVFSVFAFIFLLVLKLKRHQIKKYTKEDTINDTVAYLSHFDLAVDRLLNIAIFVCLIILAALDGELSSADILQSIIPALAAFFWRTYLFRVGSAAAGTIILRKAEKIKDEIFVFFSPLIILIISLAAKDIDYSDAYQAAALFLILFYSHKRIFKDQAL